MNRLIVGLLVVAVAVAAQYSPSTQASHVPPGTYNYVLANWVWENDKDTGESYWRAPECTRGLVDLRTIPQMVQEGGIPQGYGFFAVEAICPVPLGAIVLGDSLSQIVDPGVALEMELRAGVPSGRIAGQAVGESLWLMLTELSDPTGSTAPKPLMPDSRLLMEVHLGGHETVKRVKFKAEEHPKVLELLRLSYETVKAESLARDDDLYLKVAGYWRDKYGFDVRTAEQQRDGIKEPETIISDNFNRADESLDAGPWDEVVADWEVLNNMARNPTATVNGSARYTTPLSGADQFSQVIYAATNATARFAGPAARFAGAAETYYVARSRPNTSATHVISKVVAGTLTNLQITAENPAPSTPFTVKLEVNGTTLKHFSDGVQQGADLTDSAIDGTTVGGFYAGMYAIGSTVDLDDFLAEDLGAPPASGQRIINIIGSIMMGVLRD